MAALLVAASYVEGLVLDAGPQDRLVAADVLCDRGKARQQLQTQTFALVILLNRNFFDMANEAEIVNTAW